MISELALYSLEIAAFEFGLAPTESDRIGIWRRLRAAPRGSA
jgi:hypothetical protein